MNFNQTELESISTPALSNKTSCPLYYRMYDAVKDKFHSTTNMSAGVVSCKDYMNDWYCLKVARPYGWQKDEATKGFNPGFKPPELKEGTYEPYDLYMTIFLPSPLPKNVEDKMKVFQDLLFREESKHFGVTSPSDMVIIKDIINRDGGTNIWGEKIPPTKYTLVGFNLYENYWRFPVNMSLFLQLLRDMLLFSGDEKINSFDELLESTRLFKGAVSQSKNNIGYTNLKKVLPVSNITYFYSLMGTFQDFKMDPLLGWWSVNVLLSRHSTPGWDSYNSTLNRDILTKNTDHHIWYNRFMEAHNS